MRKQPKEGKRNEHQVAVVVTVTVVVIVYYRIGFKEVRGGVGLKE